MIGNFNKLTAKKEMSLKHAKPRYNSIDVKVYVIEGKNYHTETSLASLLNHFGGDETPLTLHKNDIKDFNSVRKRIPKFYTKKRCTLKNVKDSLLKEIPVLVSVIFDSNVKSKRRTTLLVYGFTEKSVLLVNNGRKMRMDYSRFRKVWKRTNNDTWIGV